MQAGERARGEREPSREGDQPLHLMTGGVRAAADAERYPPVRGGVGHRGDQQADRVGGQGRQRGAQQQVEHDIADRAEHADADEGGHLPAQVMMGQPRGRPAGIAQRGHLDGAAHQPAAQPHDAAQVSHRGRDDVHPGVGVVDPVHRHLVDPQPGALGQHQQLGVEEPAGVLGERQQHAGLLAPDRLEAALRVGESGAQAGVQQQVVAAGDDLAAWSADHPRATGEPGADRQVAVPGQQRRHQRKQGVQVGRQVNVHVGEDVRHTDGPDGPQRPAAARLLQVDGADLDELTAQGLGDRPGPVGAAVVGDGDPGGERESLAQVGAEPPDAGREIPLLVAYRHDDLHLGALAAVQDTVIKRHGLENRRRGCAATGRRLCACYEPGRLATSASWAQGRA